MILLAILMVLAAAFAVGGNAIADENPDMTYNSVDMTYN
jgi:hypothetical protein